MERRGCGPRSEPARLAQALRASQGPRGCQPLPPPSVATLVSCALGGPDPLCALWQGAVWLTSTCPGWPAGYLLFRDFCLNHLEEARPLVEFYEEVRRGQLGGAGTGARRACWGPEVTWEHCPQIRKYEKLETEEERVARSREIFDSYIMKELLACSHVSAPADRAGQGDSSPH